MHAAGALDHQTLHFHLEAAPRGRPDGDICALDRTAGDHGTSPDPRVTCRVETPDGRTFEAASFTRRFPYRSLMTHLCQAGVHMQQSPDCSGSVTPKPAEDAEGLPLEIVHLKRVIVARLAPGRAFRARAAAGALVAVEKVSLTAIDQRRASGFHPRPEEQNVDR